MIGYLNTAEKNQCFGCGACAQACPVSAISMEYDEEKFIYPLVDKEKCINCSKCHKVCPYEVEPSRSKDDKFAFGGQNIDPDILTQSTSGGAFSAIVDGWCDDNYVIFGASSNGTKVYHTYIQDKKDLYKFRRSKYSQSKIGSSYNNVKKFLKEGKNVLFSGTPCQVAGLKTFLGKTNQKNLLTVEVICEGVPTPHFIDRYNEYLNIKYDSSIKNLDYRYKDMRTKENPMNGKWDFQVMYTTLLNGKNIKKDRWFNPFWSIWLKHLMSRPSCYECPFATKDRTADISLGDLWGVHLYCPDLYYKNSGASLIVCNTVQGKNALLKSLKYLNGHELDFDTALKYQSPMRKHIDYNENRIEFMKDVKSMDYSSLCKKWADRPNFTLLWQKYIWGNRQKVWLWNFRNRRKNNA